MEPGVKFIDRTTIDALKLKRYERVERLCAQRVQGPFVVRTDVGDVYCDDGYVGITDDGRVMCFETRYFERYYKAK